MREVQELTTIIGLVDAGVGIAMVPADTRSIHQDGVVYVPLRDKEAFSTLYLAFRSRGQNAHLRGLLDELRSHPEVSSAAGDAHISRP